MLVLLISNRPTSRYSEDTVRFTDSVGIADIKHPPARYSDDTVRFTDNVGIADT